MKFHPKIVKKIFVADRNSVEIHHGVTFASYSLLLLQGVTDEISSQVLRELLLHIAIL